MEKSILERMLREVIVTAKAAGNFIKQERVNFNYNQAEVKGLNDLVSYVDKKAEEMIVLELQQIFSEAGFIVEENTRSEKKELDCRSFRWNNKLYTWHSLLCSEHSP
jgi:myo-inositol-1(or 4)-monophosphatase